jgi:hypothetical protein
MKKEVQKKCPSAPGAEGTNIQKEVQKVAHKVQSSTKAEMTVTETHSFLFFVKLFFFLKAEITVTETHSFDTRNANNTCAVQVSFVRSLLRGLFCYFSFCLRTLSSIVREHISKRTHS